MNSSEINEMSALEKIEKMDHDLHCSICQDYFTRAITLNCSHSFCFNCIRIWEQNHLLCPLCRQLITRKTPSRALDNIVATLKNVACPDWSEVVRNENTLGLSINKNNYTDYSSTSEDEYNDDQFRATASSPRSIEGNYFDSVSMTDTEEQFDEIEREEGEEVYNQESAGNPITEEEEHEELYNQRSDIENVSEVTYSGNSNYDDICEVGDENQYFEPESDVEVYSSDDGDNDSYDNDRYSSDVHDKYDQESAGEWITEEDEREELYNQESDIENVSEVIYSGNSNYDDICEMCEVGDENQYFECESNVVEVYSSDDGDNDSYDNDRYSNDVHDSYDNDRYSNDVHDNFLNAVDDETVIEFEQFSLNYFDV